MPRKVRLPKVEEVEDPLPDTDEVASEETVNTPKPVLRRPRKMNIAAANAQFLIPRTRHKRIKKSPVAVAKQKEEARFKEFLLLINADAARALSIDGPDLVIGGMFVEVFIPTLPGFNECFECSVRLTRKEDPEYWVQTTFHTVESHLDFKVAQAIEGLIDYYRCTM